MRFKENDWVYGPDPAGCHGPELPVCVDSGPALGYSEGQISAGSGRKEKNP
ncbi:hypothetical protein [Mesorhizobium sp. RIZ17]|uniref:hypothetical protein n=1 Tax=Mesorhizobium sp. RIZ17 TaxID=3132743 RepID=UPI003DA8FC5D